MKQDNKKRIIRRYLLVIAFVLVLVGYIVAHLMDTTIRNRETWLKLSDKILSREEFVEPERGNIYASNGSLLAGNVYYYIGRLDFGVKSVATPDSLLKYLPALCDSLQSMFPDKKAAVWESEIKSQLYRSKKNRSYKLVSRITPAEFDRMKKFPFLNRRSARNFFYKEDISVRIKPFGKMASRSIGKVGFYRNDTLMFADKKKHGISGLEMALDTLLYGVPGIATNINLNNRMVKYATTPALRGRDIKTTIDVDIQDIVEEELYSMCVESNADWGTAILMEVATGEIKAISNLSRRKNTNIFEEGINHAVLGYEPGSVMKPISMLVALEDGIVSNIEDVINTGYSFPYAGGKPISDSHGAPSMKIREVIERSSNIGMAKIILRKYEKHPGQFYSRLKELGFFDKMHTGIGGETVPKVDSLGDKNWDRIALSRMAYGYSTKIPPMSTLAIYNAIANDGKYVRPRLIKELMVDGVTDSVIPVSYIREQVCSPENAAKLRRMLNSVVWGSHGTARVLQDPKVNISGKTGTCYDLVNGGYDTSKKRLAFCGFFPYENPKYSCMVLISHANRGAARCSGMVLKNVALKLYSRGLLDNESNYVKDSGKRTVSKAAGRIYAASDVDLSNIAVTNMGINNAVRIKSRGSHSNIPDVRGLGLRDAVNLLESSGLKVKFRGSGYVVSQSINPGDSIPDNKEINIVLKI
ncbi:MAG: transpeptidase family protein [Muribaculaceae bacterium]|nr:transpeptidase family protein [Muribaculaceae bacterium]